MGGELANHDIDPDGAQSFSLHGIARQCRDEQAGQLRLVRQRAADVATAEDDETFAGECHCERQRRCPPAVATAKLLVADRCQR